MKVTWFQPIVWVTAVDCSLSVRKCVLCVLVYVCLCFLSVFENVSYADGITRFSKPIEEHVISEAEVPRFSCYISSISMSALCYMNEINLREGGTSNPFQKIRHFPSYREKALDFLLLCLIAATVESWLYDTMIHWQPNESHSPKLFMWHKGCLY